MKISTKGRYALRFLLDLAEHNPNGFTSLKLVAERQNISKKYLEQIVTPLQNAELLIANRGHQGGYSLTKAASDYNIAEILEVTETSMSTVACMGFVENDCPRKDECLTLPLWQGLNNSVYNYLHRYSLQDLLDRKVKPVELVRDKKS